MCRYLNVLEKSSTVGVTSVRSLITKEGRAVDALSSVTIQMRKPVGLTSEEVGNLPHYEQMPLDNAGQLIRVDSG